MSKLGPTWLRSHFLGQGEGNRLPASGLTFWGFLAGVLSRSLGCRKTTFFYTRNFGVSVFDTGASC